MKKLLTLAVAISLCAFALTASAQEKYVAGGFEAAGHVTVGAGYQHMTKNPNPEMMTDQNYVTYSGPIGKYLYKAPWAYGDAFEFFIDEVELDLMKSFGENIRLRADLDFGRVASGSQQAFNLEQAYATANIPLGNGIEFLIGRFNIPMGFEAVDVADNDTISKTALGRGLHPDAGTGLKFYYSFSDLIDLHFWVINTLWTDTIFKSANIPGLGLRLGFNWGDEGAESTVGISPIFGPTTQFRNKNFTYGGDVDMNWWITESFALGVEGLFIRAGKTTKVTGVTQGSNSEVAAGLLNLHYVFSDVWDGTLKYAFTKQWDQGPIAAAANNGGVWLGYEGTSNEIILAGQYAIADAAKLKLEGRFDMLKPGAGNFGGKTGMAYDYGGALAFSYDF